MGKSSEKRREVNDLLDRVATSLEAGELPTVQDSVDLELLALQYWEKDAALSELGIVERVDQRLPVCSMEKEEIPSIINHFVGRKTHGKEQSFAGLIRHYLNGDITGSNLFGEKDRKPRLGYVWQCCDQLGELAERVHNELVEMVYNKRERKDIKKHLLKTGNRSLSDRSCTNLYDLLEALSMAAPSIDKIVRDYSLSSEHRNSLSDAIDTLTSIRKEFNIDPQSYTSSSTWRDCHAEYKNPAKYKKRL